MIKNTEKVITPTRRQISNQEIVYSTCSYDGEFKEDKKSGYGKFDYSDQSVYEGEWSDD